MDNDMNDGDYCLKLNWRDHHSNFVSLLYTLMKKEVLVDVTLAAEGKFIEAHKLVLCTCSEYFQDALSSHDTNKQAYIFLNNVAFDDLKALVDYMYKGEVNVTQDQLPRFLAAAEVLKIKGLSDKVEPVEESENQEEIAPNPKKAPRNKRRNSQDISSGSLPAPESPLQQLESSELSAPDQLQQSQASCNVQQESLETRRSHLTRSLRSDAENFVAIQASEDEIELDHQQGDGLGTLDKVWSISQENGNEWDENDEPPANSESYVSYQTDPTNNSIDYNDHNSQLPIVDATLGVPGFEEVLPGPSSSNRQMRNKVNYSSRSSTTSRRGRFSNGTLVCPTCGRHYTQKGSLNRHLKFECGIIPKFACQICPMRFRRAYKLTEHYNRIHGSNPTK